MLNQETIRFQAEQFLAANRRSIYVSLQSSMLICLCMLIDNGTALPHIFVSREFSVYFGFFNSVVFTGMFGTYIATMIVAIACMPLIAKSIKSGERIENSIKWYARIVIQGSVTLMIGYAFFILLLSLFVPFTNTFDAQSGLDYYPYVRMSLQGKPWVHILAILFNGLLTGAIIASITTIAMVTFENHALAVIMPFVIKFAFVQVCRVFMIPTMWRIDYWLYMRDVYKTNASTMLLSSIVVVIFTTFGGAYAIHRRNVLYHARDVTK